MSEIHDAVSKAMAKRVMQELDLDAMAKELAPKVQAEVMAGIVKGLKEVYWGEMVMDALYSQHAMLDEFILNALGIPMTPKRKK